MVRPLTMVAVGWMMAAGAGAATACGWILARMAATSALTVVGAGTHVRVLALGGDVGATGLAVV
ncbi:hypothetical protein CCP3SC1AL1_4780001 [Gammaproteobacteria bacterium]